MKKTNLTTEPTPKSRHLESPGRPGESDGRRTADLVAEGEATNALTALRFVSADQGGYSPIDMVNALRARGEAINRGDLSAAERMLNSQAVALNAIFAELARRAALNMGTHLGATETYMRLALKAQSQSRATVEALAAMKCPPLVFAQQANIAHGPQQVNNRGAANAAKYAPVGARPRETTFTPNELFEGTQHGGAQLDTRATEATGRAHQVLAPVGAINRPPDR